MDKYFEILKWAVSEEALEASIYLPEGCSRMNGPERITAEICVDNLQKEIRKRIREAKVDTTAETTAA